MNITVQMELPETIFAIFHQDQAELVSMVKLCTAIKLYELQRISQEKAAEFAGMTRGEFLLALHEYQATPYQYSAGEVIEEVKQLGY
jgi:predicted HTH domain antitoxin